ncbi:putative membrane protein [Enterobacter sp. J49]|nr:putative membrane protein [Enterobacter sp. J49]
MPRHHLWVRFLKGVIMCVIIFLIFLGVLAYWIFPYSPGIWQTF